MSKIINIPASKSISNRLLILQYLYPDIDIQGLSTSKDTEVLQTALKQIKNTKNPGINIGHAGTAMRFLTALLSSLDNKKAYLQGSERMHQRPIKILVDALQQLGADIHYEVNTGYPPLKINGKKLTKSLVKVPANISSQYITALMLIAPKLHNGLQIELSGNKVSVPYIEMTAKLMNALGFQVNYQENSIVIKPQNTLPKQNVNVESDWSSAAYFYEAMSILNIPELRLSSFYKDSLQGDRALVNIYEKLGVTTNFLSGNIIQLRHNPEFTLPKHLDLDLCHQPDLAQSIAVNCLAKGITCNLTGLQTLRIKETDRIFALKTEMEKLGAQVSTTDKSLQIVKPEISHTHLIINTYDDHRMAMSFGILTKIYPELQIADKDVVVKSFPDFWNSLEKIKI